MIRDRIKTEEYFQEAFEWYSKCLQDALERFDKVKPESLSDHFRFRVINYEDLLRVGYSLGKDVQELFTTRSEERRVGKECRSRWSPDL